MTDFTLDGFVAKLAELTVAVHEAEHAALEQAAKLVEREAKAEIGHYQDKAGPFSAWEPLASEANRGHPSTVEEKQRLGYAPPDNPELREGDLRNSYEHTVIGREAHVGSDYEVAEWQELGTDRMPPRSILGSALVHKTDDVVKIVGDGVYGALIGRRASGGAGRVIE